MRDCDGQRITKITDSGDAGVASRTLSEQYELWTIDVALWKPWPGPQHIIKG